MLIFILCSWVCLSLTYDTLIRIVAGSVGPWQLIVFILGTAYLWSFLLSKTATPNPTHTPAKITPKENLIILGLALVTVIGAHALWNYAMTYGHFGTVVTVSVIPFEGLWGMLLFREHISRATWVGWLIAITGVALMFLQLTSTPITAGLPELCGFIGGALFALSAVMRRFLSSAIPPAVISRRILGYEVLAAAIASAMTGQITNLPPTPTGYVLFLGIGAIVAALSIVATLAVRRTSLVIVGSIFLVKPAVSFVIGILLFQQPATSVQIVGAVLVTAGTAWALEVWRVVHRV